MTDDLRRWAYASTVAGGALVLGGAVLMLFFWLLLGGLGWAGHWWTPGHAEMPHTGFPFGLFVSWGLLAGLVVLWAGVRMRPGGPGEGRTEGVVAIVASVLSFPAMGGFMFGALLGVVGGALSLASEGARPDGERSR